MAVIKKILSAWGEKITEQVSHKIKTLGFTSSKMSKKKKQDTAYSIG